MKYHLREGDDPTVLLESKPHAKRFEWMIGKSRTPYDVVQQVLGRTKIDKMFEGKQSPICTSLTLIVELQMGLKLPAHHGKLKNLNEMCARVRIGMDRYKDSS